MDEPSLKVGEGEGEEYGGEEAGQQGRAEPIDNKFRGDEQGGAAGGEQEGAQGQPAVAVGAAAAAPRHADDGDKLERANRVLAVRAAVGGAGQRPVCIQTVEEDVQRVAQEKANDGGDDGGQGVRPSSTAGGC